ncbi:hypothetical protein N0V90_003772 [Kalmusia sp. IMI 367209]|nr:hypothetical protein N0V90_003772 [Kalmusia sp. IMI 367209]
MAKRKLSAQAPEGRQPLVTFTPSTTSSSPFSLLLQQGLTQSQPPQTICSTPEQNTTSGATGWYFTTIGNYVPTVTLRNILALPFRAADRFWRPQKIRVENFVREDGACKVRLVDVGAGDLVTPTKARSTKRTDRTHQNRQAKRSPESMPGAWPVESPPAIDTGARHSPLLNAYQTPPHQYTHYTHHGTSSGLDDLGTPDWESATPPAHIMDLLIENGSPLNQHLRPAQEVPPPKNIFVVEPNVQPLPRFHVGAEQNCQSSSSLRYESTAAHKSPNSLHNIRSRTDYQRNQVLRASRVSHDHRRGRRVLSSPEEGPCPESSDNIWIAEATRTNEARESHYKSPDNARTAEETQDEVAPLSSYEHWNISKTNQINAKTSVHKRAGDTPQEQIAVGSTYDNDESTLPDAPPARHVQFNDHARVKLIQPYISKVYVVEHPSGVREDQLPYRSDVQTFQHSIKGNPVRSPLVGYGSSHFKEVYPYAFKKVYLDSEVANMQDKALNEVKKHIHKAYNTQDTLLADIQKNDQESSFLEDLKNYDGERRNTSETQKTPDDSFEDLCAATDAFIEGDHATTNGDESFDVDGPSLENDTKGGNNVSDDIPGPLAGEDKSLEESMFSLELAKDLIAALPTPTPTPSPPPAPTIQPLVAELTKTEHNELELAAQNAKKNQTTPLVKFLTAHDFGTLLPSEFHGDPLAWLNDNIVDEYISILVEHVKKMENYTHKRNGPAPPVHAFGSQWYTTMLKNEKSVGRWAGKKQLGGKNFLDCKLVLFPICDGNHWRLIAIKPQERLVEYFDSLGGQGHRYTDTVLRYLELELGEHFVASEWTTSGADKSEQKSKRQENSRDCGIFTVLNALVLLRGEEHTRVEVTTSMNVARRRVAASLLAGKPTTEFD